MNIIIVGCGKVGLTLAEQLCQEDHAITLIDTDQERLDDAVNSMDVQAVLGNGTSYQTQVEAGVKDADLLIAVTDQDELNMLACLIARKVGNCQTIARVRNPSYYQDIHYIKDDLGLAMVINPEWAAAQDIFRLLQIPSALDVDTFDKGKVNMIRFQIAPGSPLDGKNMMAINNMLGGKMLVCIRERAGEVVIPSGNTDLKAGDKISVVIPMAEIGSVLQRLRLRKRAIHSVLIAGGGNTAVYLTLMLQKAGLQVKIIENSLARCEELAERVPKAHIIHGDSTDKQLLQEEGLRDAEAFVCLTGLDAYEHLKGFDYARKIQKYVSVTPKGVTYIDEHGDEQFVPADLVVLSGGVAAVPEQCAAFYGAGKHMHYIGDCYRPGDVHKAVTAGFATGSQI